MNENSNQRGVKFRGSAAQNEKTKPTQPDFKGSQTIDGKDYWVAFWVNRNDDGSPWLSFEHEAKVALPNLVDEFKKEVGDPLAEFGGSQQAPAQTQGQQSEDEDVPF